MPPPQRVLDPPPRGYVAEWQVQLEVAVWGMTTVYAAFHEQVQRDIETAWVRGHPCIFWVPESAQTWRIDLNSLTMRRVNCQLREQVTRPVRRVFVPAGTASEVRDSSAGGTHVEWT